MQPDAHDRLTGLLSRRAVEAAISYALAGYDEDRGIVAVILVDVDDFKRVNDRFGYYAGDELLRRVALRLEATAREDAILGRLGGDEFIVLCPDTTVPRAHELAGRIEVAMTSLVMNREGREIRSISVSTGLAYGPRDGRRTADLIQAADLAMFREKRGDDESPPAPMVVPKPAPKPRPGTAAQAPLQDDKG